MRAQEIFLLSMVSREGFHFAFYLSLQRPTHCQAYLALYHKQSQVKLSARFTGKQPLQISLYYSAVHHMLASTFPHSKIFKTFKA